MSWSVALHQTLSWPLRCWVLLLLYLGIGGGLASARHPQQIHPGLPGVCRAIISKVQSYTESNLQSSLVGVRGGICTWLELNGCQQYKVVFTPVYKISFRAVYANSFVCCTGYTRIGNSCEPSRPTTAVPPMTTPSRLLPGSAQPATGPPRPPASDNDQDGSSSLVPGFTGVFMTPRLVTPLLAPGPSAENPTITGGEGLPGTERTPSGEDVDPPPGGPRDRLLIILLILVILVALFALASFAFHLARLWRRGRLACCFGMLSLPRIHTGRNASGEDSQKINCILSTISSDCSTESVRSDLSYRSGSDQSGQSGRSGCSEVAVLSDDSDSGIVKHAVYERCWKDTASLLSAGSSSQTSRGSRSKKCTPLLAIPLTPLTKKRRPSPPLPIRPEPIYDTTPRSAPLPLLATHTKRSSPIPRQPSPGPYSYTSLNKQNRKTPSPNVDSLSQPGRNFAVVPSPNTTEDYHYHAQEPVTHRYINVKSAIREKPRPVYVTLDPATASDSVFLGTECREGDDDPWVTSHSPASSISSVGYCALSNQVFPHRVSGNGYDKLERCGQNLPLAPESFPRPEYAVPSVTASTTDTTTSTSCLVVETETEDLVSRASPDIRRSGTLPSMTLEYLKLNKHTTSEDPEQEERYIRAPRHNHKEMVFIDTARRIKITTTPNIKHNSVG